MGDQRGESKVEFIDTILQAVVEEFNEKGIKFTMDDISKRLGISKRTLYLYVKDKDSLFLEAVRSVFVAIKEAKQEVIDTPGLDIVEKLKKTLIVLPEKYRQIDYKRLYEVKEKYPKIYVKVEEGLEAEWEGPLKLLEQAKKEGRIKDMNPVIFRAMFTGTMEHFISKRILLENQLTYEDALAEMIDILIDGIRIGE